MGQDLENTERNGSDVMDDKQAEIRLVVAAHRGEWFRVATCKTKEAGDMLVQQFGGPGFECITRPTTYGQPRRWWQVWRKTTVMRHSIYLRYVGGGE